MGAAIGQALPLAAGFVLGWLAGLDSTTRSSWPSCAWS